ncbi:collagen-like protein [Robiginitalea sp. IMCC44478]|uniref:collagen-like protein n=1 Tax=Robiginitalea sp. IMCC44478 TaxID=3459122 RepID=UPI004043169A
MKKFSLLSAMIIAFFSLSCEGPVGPPGPPGFDGLDGLDGVNILGTVYDITGDFTPGNDYSLFSEFSLDAPGLEVFETDVVLVYILWEQIPDDQGGAPIDIWRLLPQTRLLDQGILQYNYDHTFLDVSIFLEANFDLATLPPGDTDNQTFRIAILPADGVGAAKLDVSNMKAVLDYMNVKEATIQKVYTD